MLTKPLSCRSCPLYGTGVGYVPDHYPLDVRTVLIRASPEIQDIIQGRWVSEYYYDKYFLPLAGESRETIGTSHLLRCRWSRATGKNPLPTAGELREAVACCSLLAKEIPSTVTLQIVEGAVWKNRYPHLPLEDWRGFLAPPEEGQPRTLAMKDIQAFHTDSALLLTLQNDWQRVRAFHQGKWPSSLPQTTLWGSRALWLMNLQAQEKVVIDTEYTYPGDPHLLICGLYAPSLGTLQWAQGSSLQELTQFLKELIASHGVIFHNSFADLYAIEFNCGLTYQDYKAGIDDSMLLDAVLWSERSHRLEYLASLYGTQEKLKHLAEENPLLYNQGDVIETHAVFKALEKQARMDTQAWSVYQTLMLPLIPIVHDTQKCGIAIDLEGTEQLAVQLEAQIQAAIRVAELYVGFPLNLGSPFQLPAYMEKVEGVKMPNGSKDTIAELRAKYLPFDPREEDSINLMLQRIEEGAHPLLEARNLYSTANQIFTHYIRPFRASGGRIYPRYHLWTQANARWSIVEPPMQQITAGVKKLLRPDPDWPWLTWDMDQAELRVMAVLADDGVLKEAFAKGWDIHTMHMCQALGLPLPPDLTDPHEAPINEDWRLALQWKGKGDIRRTFAKTFIYRLLYGGNPKTADGIIGARQLGLNGARLVEVAEAWLKAHPPIKRFWAQLTANGLKTGITRNIYGRPRRYLSMDLKRRQRQMYDHPMQASVADIKNETIIQAFAQIPHDEVRFVLEVHDYIAFALRVDTWERNTAILKRIAERPLTYRGETFSIPASFHEEWPS